MSDSTVRELADPHLHAIRMVARNIKVRDRVLGGQIETARFNLFTSLESEDYDGAMNWLNSLDAGLGCLAAEEHPATDAVAIALRGLRQVIEDETTEAPDSEEDEEEPEA